MSMTVGQIETAMRALRRRLYRLEVARNQAIAREAKQASVLAAFDAGNTNTDSLAAKHGLTHAAVRSMIYRSGRSVIERRRQKMRKLAELHGAEQVQA